QCASLRADGTIHLVAMWYGFWNGHTALETFAKSQQVLNLRRDPRITVLVEQGAAYAELRGVQITGRAVIHYDDAIVLDVVRDVMRRHLGVTDAAEVEAIAVPMARKRVAVEVVPDRVVSWDHHKLSGGY